MSVSTIKQLSFFFSTLLNQTLHFLFFLYSKFSKIIKIQVNKVNRLLRFVLDDVTIQTYST